MAKKHFWLLVILTLALLFFLSIASCYNSSDIYNQPPSVPDEVNIYDNFFDPDSLTVTAGTRVTWNNLGYHNHSATSDQGDFDSGTLNPGGSFSFTFQNKGRFSYHCNFHSGMKANIIVR